eukprot:m.294211 g.294211  ORF g.294211 m.294211 type:complete len:591 (+) comp39984_c0_seq1:88-1860(+)
MTHRATLKLVFFLAIIHQTHAIRLSPSLSQAIAKQDHRQRRFDLPDIAVIVFFDKLEITEELIDRKIGRIFRQTNVYNRRRRELVIQLLQEHANRTQAEIIAHLEATGRTYRSYFASNALALDAVPASSAAAELDSYKGARYADLNEPKNSTNAFETPIRSESEASSSLPETHVVNIGADQVWSMGYTGRGVTLGVTDTGADHTHPALKHSYRGYKAKKDNFNHNYNWMQPRNISLSTPHDPIGHGSHVTGVACGGRDKAVGVAPDAKWMGCAAFFDLNNYKVEDLVKCLQFMLAPTNQQGLKPRPSRGADISVNSWECHNCDPITLDSATTALTMSGVAVLASAQNKGPACFSLTNIPGTLVNVLTIGALAENSSLIASLSSRGPVQIGSTELRVKPDFVAPGSNILSAGLNSTYERMSGTSQATPAAAGAIALIWDAVPELQGLLQLTYGVLALTAKSQATEDCVQGVTGARNNVYGYGAIDAAAAVRLAILAIRGEKCLACLQPCFTMSNQAQQRTCQHACDKAGCVRCGQRTRQIIRLRQRAGFVENCEDGCGQSSSQACVKCRRQKKNRARKLNRRQKTFNRKCR